MREIADELNALLAQHNPPGDDKAIPSIVAIGEWVTELEAQDLLTQERMLIGGFPKAYASSGTAGNWGAGKVQIKALRERYWELVTGDQSAPAIERTARPAPPHRVVRRELRGRSAARPATPGSTTSCSGRATCCEPAPPPATTSATASAPC